MTNILQLFEKKQVDKLSEGKKLPDFKAGDTLKVSIKIKEGNNERIQIYEGLCISKCHKGLGSNFTVRKISFSEGVERTFPLYSPSITDIKVVKKGKVRRAKLYYMRDLRGKATRLEEIRDNIAPVIA